MNIKPPVFFLKKKFSSTPKGEFLKTHFSRKRANMKLSTNKFIKLNALKQNDNLRI
jgi:hypothetical protein